MYHTEFEGTHYELGTSGFLYRSSKLMYDEATNSLWSTLQGRPVLGPLVGKGIQLISDTVVTTDWGTWRKTHPETKVISLVEVEKRFTRNYDEGVAYQAYFADHTLMFPVPKPDERLENKSPVLALRLRGANIGSEPKPIAFESEFLVANPVHHHQYAGINVVLLTDSSGAHRAYDAEATKFVSLENDTTVIDDAGAKWSITTDALVDDKDQKLARLPSHNVFWFGWATQFPETELIQLRESAAEAK